MSRALLFVQTGDAQPKCVGAPPGRDYSRKTQVGFSTTDAQGRAVESADRWWLVECENAEAGWFVIAWYTAPHHRGEKTEAGRILASGGRP